MMLKSVLRFVFDNIEIHCHQKKITRYDDLRRAKIDTKTVEKYLEAFVGDYII